MAITKVTSGLISADASSIDLNIDAGTLYLDVSENRVGIGTTSPTGKLEISATGTNAAPHIKLVESGDTREFNIYNDGSGNAHLVLADSDDDTPDTEIVLNDNGIITMLTGNSERMRIDSSGNLLVGTSGTIYGTAGRGVLEVNGSSSSVVALKVSDAAAGYMYHSGNNMDVWNNLAGYLRFATNGTERMRINASGQVLIGTSTNPTYNHSCVVSGNANIDGVLRVEDIDGTVGLSNTCLGLAFPNDADATSGYFVYMTDSNNNVGSITAASGTSVSFNTTSDERLKKNIVDASSQLDTIKNIQVREFDWKRNDVHEVGVVAQELINIIPDAVHEGGEDEAKNPFGVDYGKIVPYLIKAVQEQQTIIDNLTTRIETLENA